MQDRVGVPLRWGGALAIVLALHAMAAWMLLSRSFPPLVMPAAPEAVMLDLAPELPPAQPASVVLPAPVAVPPPPASAAEAPPPVPMADPVPAELPPMPPVQAEAVLPVPPPPPRPQVKPKPKPKPRPVERPVERPIEREAPPRVAEEMPRSAPVQTTPAAARPPAPASTVSPSWRSDLLSRLQRAKRYPELARAHGDQGVATVTFTMDRAGRVLAVTLVRSSGSALLDDEAVSLVRRAEPLPSLPAEMPGNTITLTVPISFALR